MSEWGYLIAIAAVAVGGFLVRSLSVSGAVATVLVGLAVAYGFSWKGLLLLGAFFASSSFWSHFRKQQKQRVAEKVEKGSQRDYIQVLANGSIPAFIGILSFLFPSSIWEGMFVVSIAAANADTWASEIGSISRHRPRLITTWKKTEPGTSGAVTMLGTLASFSGALVIAVIGAYLWSSISVVMISVIGFFGSVFDTYMGAVWQALYRCRVCGIETEKKEHCNKETVQIKGKPLINNDLVNWLAIACSTAVYFFVTYID
ncbi:DUF92 domain-containing protein [Anoxybacteroides tepidamans]|uniref:DUF92 domain-containing protein n=1 Tax=Anoxybacteroides tepidamans TaxID=265948 RepID=UPI0004834E55|nr:DUF92 domain-containing protein [Anoxybacillus tepidamans]